MILGPKADDKGSRITTFSGWRCVRLLISQVRWHFPMRGTRVSALLCVSKLLKSADALRAIAGLNLTDFDGCLVSVYLALAGVTRKP